MKDTGKRIFLFVLALMLAMPATYSATVLEVGSSGENVRKVQQRLIQYDYLDGEADGKYGEKTRDAVMLFQRRNGLTVDGRVGPDTAAALGVTLSSSGSSSSSATIISADHRLLAKLVYAEARGESYKGQVAVAAVVCLTLIGTVICAKLVGCVLPLLAKKIGFDPAVMASPFISTIVDALSLLIYFQVAAAILRI